MMLNPKFSWFMTQPVRDSRTSGSWSLLALSVNTGTSNSKAARSMRWWMWPGDGDSAVRKNSRIMYWWSLKRKHVTGWMEIIPTVSLCQTYDTYLDFVTKLSFSFTYSWDSSAFRSAGSERGRWAWLSLVIYTFPGKICVYWVFTTDPSLLTHTQSSGEDTNSTTLTLGDNERHNRRTESQRPIGALAARPWLLKDAWTASRENQLLTLHGMLELGFIANSSARSQDVSRNVRNVPVNIRRESELIRVNRHPNITFR
jgi:hypothetical protein